FDPGQRGGVPPVAAALPVQAPRQLPSAAGRHRTDIRAREPRLSGRLVRVAPPSYARALEVVGRVARARVAFLLMLAALGWGVLREAARPMTWRRTVRAEFRRALYQAAIGGLATTMVTAGLTGLALVSQALYWLGLAGQAELEGPVLVTILVRELAPLL